GLRDELAARIESQRGTVEDEAVVAAGLVAHEHRDAVAAGDGGQHFAANGALVVPERRGRKVDVQRRALPHELFHGIDGVEAAPPEILVVPGVLADGDGEAETLEVDDLLGPGWGEVALLVKDVIEGQEPLVLLEEQLAAVDKDGGVE